MIIIYIGNSGYTPGFDSELLSHCKAFDIIKSIYVSNSQGVSGIIYGVEI